MTPSLLPFLSSLHLLLATDPLPFVSQYGSLAIPSGADYDYDRDYVEKTEEFVPTLRARLFSAVVSRSYSPHLRRHFYHSHLGDFRAHVDRGFQREEPLGRIIPLFVMGRRPMLHQVCPQLVELYSVLEPETASVYLTTEYVEVSTRLHQGWRRLTSIGFCVRSSHPGVCGAKRGLMHLVGVAKGGNDNFYTTDEAEYARANSADVQFRGTGRGPLCYLW